MANFGKNDIVPPNGHHYVYVIHRSDSHMKYVGCTKVPLSQRLAEHLRSGTLPGATAEVVSIELLEECPTNNARECEAHWIQEFGTLDPTKGYNIHSGTSSRSRRYNPMRRRLSRAEFTALVERIHAEYEASQHQ